MFWAKEFQPQLRTQWNVAPTPNDSEHDDREPELSGFGGR